MHLALIISGPLGFPLLHALAGLGVVAGVAVPATGPEPTFGQLRNGEVAGAVSVHRLAADFDTGPIPVALPVPIGPHDTHGLHRGQLALAGVAAGRQRLAGLRGEVPLPDQSQHEAAARYWRRLACYTCLIT